MKITGESLEITPEKSIPWADVKTLRILNDKLLLTMEDGTTIELDHVHPMTADRAFRAYEQYLWHHPEKKRPFKKSK